MAGKQLLGHFFILKEGTVTVSQRRRRAKKQAPRSSERPRRQRRPPKKEIDWKDVGIKTFIGLFLLFDIILVLFIIRRCAKPPTEEPIPVQENRILQIEVLNGCGVSGIANTFTDYLRSRGIDVVKTDNYESFNVVKTVVIDRQGNKANALRIAKVLGFGEDRILQEVSDVYLIDGSVIIGMDYQQLPSWKKMEQPDAR